MTPSARLRFTALDRHLFRNRLTQTVIINRNTAPRKERVQALADISLSALLS